MLHNNVDFFQLLTIKQKILQSSKDRSFHLDQSKILNLKGLLLVYSRWKKHSQAIRIFYL